MLVGSVDCWIRTGVFGGLRGKVVRERWDRRACRRRLSRMEKRGLVLGGLVGTYSGLGGWNWSRGNGDGDKCVELE